MANQDIPQGPEPTYDKVVSGYQTFHHPQPFTLDWGGALPSFDIAWESWGEISETRDNVVLLHTGLSASSHARSHADNTNPGWWEEFIGPGAPLDTDRFHVICTQAMRDIVKAFRRPPAVRLSDRNGGFPRLSDGVAHGFRCPTSPRHALLAENLGKPSLWVIIKDLWYNNHDRQARAGFPRCRTLFHGQALA